MKIIAHRRNTIKQLQKTNRKYGVEVDIRSNGKKMITHHEPFEKGELFDEWINEYKHKTLILNVKEEGLENDLIKIMQEKKIDDYFFLDQSFPFIIKCANNGEKRCAVRVSEFENIATALTLAGKINWVWTDCFNQFPLNHSDAQNLKNAGFKICIVSPELQGHNNSNDINKLAILLKKRNILADAVCTKFPETWEKITYT